MSSLSESFNLYKLLSSLNLVNTDKMQNMKVQLNEWKDTKRKEIELIKEYSTDLINVNKKNFGEKIHTYRESYLSILFNEDKNFKSIYFYIHSIFFWIFLWVVVEDFKNYGKFLDLSLLEKQLSNPFLVVSYLLIIYSIAFLVVIFIQIIKLFTDKYKYIPYRAVFIVYTLYYLAFYYIVSKYFFTHKIFGISGIIIGCELVRSTLKVHAYFRDKLLYGFKAFHIEYAEYHPKNTTRMPLPQIEIHGFSTEFRLFIYFFFCPSLIYRDNYPMLKNIRWNMVFKQFYNFITSIFGLYLVFRYVCDPFLSNYKLENFMSLNQFIYDALFFAFPGVCILALGFYLLLHSWMNLWAELLKFADRHFYEDWWTCTNFEEYYRKWNMVVHEWLYYYVYNDCIRLSKGKFSKTIAKFTVFFLSVIAHEIVVYYWLGFFFPVLCLFFGGPGVIFTYIKPKNAKFNLLFWLKLLIGQGLITAILLREVNARYILQKNGIVSNSILPSSVLIYNYDFN